MDGIQLGKKVRGLFGESVCVQTREIVLPGKVSEEPLHFTAYIVEVAKRVSTLRDRRTDAFHNLALRVDL
jgi:hypothetical protein